MAFDKDKVDKMLPVDMYVGGPEHACMHLLYARFINKALRDMGYLDFDEPFKSLRHQGLILGPDGQKMSKSKGNTISPDEYIVLYGADVFRMYLMFGFGYSEGGAWSDEGIKGMDRYLERIERILDVSLQKIESQKPGKNTIDKEEKELNYWRNNSIKAITNDAEIMQFNTAIARLMEFTNAISKYISEENINKSLLKDVVKDFILLLSPFAPHFGEEMWEKLGMEFTVFNNFWPVYDEKALVKDEVEIAVQVNGRIKDRISIPQDISEDEIKSISLDSEEVKKALVDMDIKKVIIIKGRLVNIVAK